MAAVEHTLDPTTSMKFSQKSNQFVLVSGHQNTRNAPDNIESVAHHNMNAICGTQSHRDYIFIREQRVKIKFVYYHSI